MLKKDQFQQLLLKIKIKYKTKPNFLLINIEGLISEYKTEKEIINLEKKRKYDNKNNFFPKVYFKIYRQFILLLILN